MRKIKFRFWDKKRKIMHTAQDKFGNYYINCHGDCFEEYGGCEHGGLLDYNEDMLALQFTGLYDTDGKEIYDGDIVEFIGHARHWFNKFLVVKFNPHGGYYFSHEKERKSFSSNLAYKSEIKIVGNIYENSELLEDK